MFANILNLIYSFNVMDQVSHLRKQTTGKIVDMYNLNLYLFR
jgi:hypothetical protein